MNTRLAEATTDRMMRIVTKLRYQSYESHGWIDRNRSGHFADRYDEHPANRSFLLISNGMPVSTIRVSLSHWSEKGEYKSGIDHFPSTSTYPDALGRLFSEGKPLAEITRFAIQNGCRKDITSIFGAVVQLFDIENIEYAFAAIRKEHKQFYQRMHFKMFMGERKYSSLNLSTIGMLCHYPTARPLLRIDSMHRLMWATPLET